MSRSDCSSSIVLSGERRCRSGADTLLQGGEALVDPNQRKSVERFYRSPATVCDLMEWHSDPIPGQKIIPRNFGVGPRFLIANLSLYKAFFINSEPRQSDATQGKRFFLNRPYSLIVYVGVHNLFNRTNPGEPFGNLSSSLFGQSLFSAGDFGIGSNHSGNRRISVFLAIAF